jgi:hypothetical protein
MIPEFVIVRAQCDKAVKLQKNEPSQKLKIRMRRRVASYLSVCRPFEGNGFDVQLSMVRDVGLALTFLSCCINLLFSFHAPLEICIGQAASHE